MKPEQGRAFWNELHAFTHAYPEAPEPDDIIEAQDFLDDFAARLRKAAKKTCRCADEWDDMVAWVPPPLHDKEAFVLWAVAAHDRVNKLLMKPLFYKRSALHPFLLPRRRLPDDPEVKKFPPRQIRLLNRKITGAPCCSAA